MYFIQHVAVYGIDIIIYIQIYIFAFSWFGVRAREFCLNELYKIRVFAVSFCIRFGAIHMRSLQLKNLNWSKISTVKRTCMGLRKQQQTWEKNNTQ